MYKKIGGFTLVEISVILMLVGVMVVFSMLYVPAQIAKARDAERKGNIDAIGKFIEEYYADVGCYPVSIPDCDNPFKLGDKAYISNLPCDPRTKDSYVYVSEISSCPGWFQLYGNLEYAQDKIIDELGCRNGCGPKCQFNYGTASTNVRLNPFCQQTSTPSTSPSTLVPTLAPIKQQYVCAPGGGCEVFAYPELSGCPDIYLDDPTCQGGQWCSDPKYRCHDARGKTN